MNNTKTLLQQALDIPAGVSNRPHALVHFTQDGVAVGSLFAWRWDTVTPQEMECIYNLLNEANKRFYPEHDRQNQIGFLSPAVESALDGSMISMWVAAGMLEQESNSGLSRRAWLIKILRAGLDAYQNSAREAIEEIKRSVAECQDEITGGNNESTR